MTFSSSQIDTPSRGVFAMHPFVDVLEGRSFLCAPGHKGVFAVDPTAGGAAAGEEHSLANTSDAAVPPALEYDAGPAKPDVALNVDDGAPAHVVLPAQDE